MLSAPSRRSGPSAVALFTVGFASLAVSGGEMVAGEEEEVTVPAGTFKAVPVVYTVTEVDGKPIPKPTVYTYWYAAGVGVVKLKYDGGEKVLKSFTPGPQAKK